MKIEYVDHSLGNNYGDLIELNENLKQYPKLHHQILSHELKHTKKTFTKKDLILDLTDSPVDKKELLIFMIKNPKSFYQFLPFYWTRKHGFVMDINLIIIYSVLISLVSLGFYLAL